MELSVYIFLLHLELITIHQTNRGMQHSSLQHVYHVKPPGDRLSKGDPFIKSNYY